MTFRNTLYIETKKSQLSECPLRIIVLASLKSEKRPYRGRQPLLSLINSNDKTNSKSELTVDTELMTLIDLQGSL